MLKLSLNIYIIVCFFFCLLKRGWEVVDMKLYMKGANIELVDINIVDFDMLNDCLEFFGMKLPSSRPSTASVWVNSVLLQRAFRP